MSSRTPVRLTSRERSAVVRMAGSAVVTVTGTPSRAASMLPSRPSTRVRSRSMPSAVRADAIGKARHVSPTCVAVTRAKSWSRLVRNGPWVAKSSLVTSPSRTCGSSHQRGSRGSSIRKMPTIRDRAPRTRGRSRLCRGVRTSPTARPSGSATWARDDDRDGAARAAANRVVGPHPVDQGRPLGETLGVAELDEVRVRAPAGPSAGRRCQSARNGRSCRRRPPGRARARPSRRHPTSSARSGDTRRLTWTLA